MIGSFVLCNAKGKEEYLVPIVKANSYSFEVRSGTIPEDAKNGTKSSRGSFRCILSGTPIDTGYIREQGSTGKLGVKLIAIIADLGVERQLLTHDRHMKKLHLRLFPIGRPSQHFLNQH